MKKFFTLLSGLFFSLTLLALDGSKLSISTVNRNPEFRIEVDGRRIGLRDQSITLSNIGEGTHSIRIFRDRKNAFGFSKRGELIYAGTVFVKRGFHTDITVNRFGKVFVDECRITGENRWENDEEFDEESDWNNGFGNVLSATDFEQVKEQLQREWFEKNRLTSAKVIVDKSNFTTKQVKELMLLFTFENNRLELAKYALRKTVDRQNYFQLNDALTFSSSKEELARFIRESRY